MKSTSDERVTNNSTRQTYRKLTDAEKAVVDDIKQRGADLIAVLQRLDDKVLFGDAGIHPDLPDTEEKNRFNDRNLELARQHIEDGVMRAVRHVTT